MGKKEKEGVRIQFRSEANSSKKSVQATGQSWKDVAVPRILFIYRQAHGDV